MSLLNLGGTIPVKYRDDTYNIPGLSLFMTRNKSIISRNLSF